MLAISIECKWNKFIFDKKLGDDTVVEAATKCEVREYIHKYNNL